MSKIQRGRGRPALETVKDFSHSGPGIAQRVFTIEAQSGDMRGALAKAIREVASETGLKANTVKVYARRYAADVRDVVQKRNELISRTKELESLIFAFPEDVINAIGTLPLGRAMRFLKSHIKHSGDRPSWIVDCVRQRSEDGKDLMTRLEQSALSRN